MDYISQIQQAATKAIKNHKQLKTAKALKKFVITADAASIIANSQFIYINVNALFLADYSDSTYQVTLNRDLSVHCIK